MISKLLYRCPVCAGFDWLKGGRCVHCGARVEQVDQSHLTMNGRSADMAHWYDRVRSFDPPDGRGGLVFKSGRVRLYKEALSGFYTGLGGLGAALYGRRFVETVTTALFRDRIEIHREKGVLTIPFAALLSVTIESNVIILVDRAHGPLFLDFCEESGKKWEDGIRRTLTAYHRPGEIVEFFPRVLLAGGPGSRTPALSAANPLPNVLSKPLQRGPRKAGPGGHDPFYRLFRRLVKKTLETGLQIELTGRDHLPRKGAAVLMGNHSSFLDAIILEALAPRNIWFMTKNSQYKGRFMTWFLGLTGSFPVRRYTVDVQAVRNAVRVVQGGHMLGIFPEGERSWDDRMLPFKRGAMRLVLALGVPVIPVGISGAYGLMPRWTHRIRRVPVQVRFGSPVMIEPVPAAVQTEADIKAVTAKLREKIQALVR